jgi:hypothetical protein
MNRFTFCFALALVAGCSAAGDDQPPPEHVIGKYVYQDTGRLAKHPWTVNAALVLERDAQYTLELNFNIDNDDEHDTSYGTYRVVGDKLLLDPADETDGHGEFDEFTIAGDRLTPRLGWGARLALKGLKAKPVFVKAE